MFNEQLQRNRAAYGMLGDRLRRDYAGRYVALAEGRVVGSGGSYEEAFPAIRLLDPAPEHFSLFETDQEPVFDVIDNSW